MSHSQIQLLFSLPVAVLTTRSSHSHYQLRFSLPQHRTFTRSSENRTHATPTPPARAPPPLLPCLPARSFHCVSEGVGAAVRGSPVLRWPRRRAQGRRSKPIRPAFNPERNPCSPSRSRVSFCSMPGADLSGSGGIGFSGSFEKFIRNGSEIHAQRSVVRIAVLGSENRSAW